MSENDQRTDEPDTVGAAHVAPAVDPEGDEAAFDAADAPETPDTPGTATPETPHLPDDVDPADAYEQSLVVEYDEDDYR